MWVISDLIEMYLMMWPIFNHVWKLEKYVLLVSIKVKHLMISTNVKLTLIIKLASIP